MLKDVYRKIDRDSSRKRLLKYTRKAFKLLPRLDKPQILDAGCGSGVATIELARLCDGKVVGIDIDKFLLNELNMKIEREGLSNKVETLQCSMLELDFPEESFDIIWVEGAIRVIGFEIGLKESRRLLKPEGFFVVHDEIRSIASKLEKLPSFGFKLLHQFLLPSGAHWKEYYRPLENRIKRLFEKYKDNSEALKVLKEVQNEIDIVKENPKDYRSAFYIMQKTGLGIEI